MAAAGAEEARSHATVGTLGRTSSSGGAALDRRRLAALVSAVLTGAVILTPHPWWRLVAEPGWWWLRSCYSWPGGGQCGVEDRWRAGEKQQGIGFRVRPGQALLPFGAEAAAE